MLEFVDHRKDPSRWASRLGISREAVELYLASDVIDMHVESFLLTRLWGYDLRKRHGTGLLDARFYGHVDLPRLREARVTGGLWTITTNPARSAKTRAPVFRENLEHLVRVLSSVPHDVVICRTADDYARAVSEGRHGAFLGIQGGNALDAPGAIDTFDASLLVKVTLVHLSTSTLGTTSAPGRGFGEGRLSRRGREVVRELNARRIFLDLAHINRRGFFEALEEHDNSQPVLVSHTGIAGVHRHWRNIDDEQLLAVAKTGGVVGVMYQSSFLGDPYLGGKAESIVRHLAHIIDVIGEDHAALGSDWDGAIVTPRDMKTCLELPRLVELMLARGWKPDRIRKILGQNFLRALRDLRP